MKLLRQKAAQAELIVLQQRMRAEPEVAIIAFHLASEQPSATEAAQDCVVSAAAVPACAALAADNTDLAGWITVPDTQADCPVMYTPARPRRYYQRGFDGKYSKQGLPFIDETSAPDARNVLIYGHNMKSGAIFGELKRYLDGDFARSHDTFFFDTIHEVGVYRVVSVFRTTVEDGASFRFYDYADAEDDEAFSSYCQTVLALSEIDFGETLCAEDRLVTLATCSSHADDGRLLLVGKRVS